jgi:nicotinamidase-related amidase
MTSETRRDPLADHLITAENSVLVVIDYQQEMLSNVTSVDQDRLTNAVTGLVRTAKAFGVPTIYSTVAVEMGFNQDTIQPIRRILPDAPSFDRTSLNGWEDVEFREAVQATGRKKILMSGLWTGGCPAFTTLDALQDGYEVHAISDAMGETSADAHQQAMARLTAAGAVPTTWGVVLAELQRDYTRTDSLSDVVDILGSHLFTAQREAVAV